MRGHNVNNIDAAPRMFAATRSFSLLDHSIPRHGEEIDSLITRSLCGPAWILEGPEKYYLALKSNLVY